MFHVNKAKVWHLGDIEKGQNNNSKINKNNQIFYGIFWYMKKDSNVFQPK
jgi:hypothetical protein